MTQTRIGIGLDNTGDGLHCGRAAARAALAMLGDARPDMALLFTSHPQPAQVLKGVNAALDGIPLIGALSAGEYTHAGYVEDGAGLLLISSPAMRFHPLLHQRRWFGSGRLLGQLQGTTQAGLGGIHPHRTLMLFPDDQSMNLNQVVERAMTETALLYDILGGPGPALPEPPRGPAVFFNQRMIRTGLAGAEILSQAPLGLGLANGWTPAAGPYRVTHRDAKRVMRLDGRPAREVYEDFLLDHGYTLTDDLPREWRLRHPIGVCAGESETCQVSVVMGFDATGALLTTSPPAEQALIHILSTEPQAMFTAAQRAIQRAMAGLQARPAAGLLFIDCMSTAMVLETAYEQQREAVIQAAGELPFLGFRSHGVLARLEGQTAGHYECSVATCALPG